MLCVLRAWALPVTVHVACEAGKQLRAADFLCERQSKEEGGGIRKGEDKGAKSNEVTERGKKEGAYIMLCEVLLRNEFTTAGRTRKRARIDVLQVGAACNFAFAIGAEHEKCIEALLDEVGDDDRYACSRRKGSRNRGRRCRGLWRKDEWLSTHWARSNRLQAVATEEIAALVHNRLEERVMADRAEQRYLRKTLISVCEGRCVE